MLRSPCVTLIVYTISALIVAASDVLSEAEFRSEGTPSVVAALTSTRERHAVSPFEWAIIVGSSDHQRHLLPGAFSDAIRLIHSGSASPTTCQVKIL